MKPLFRYRARLTRVVDGDTVRLDLDLGLKIWVLDQILRLIDIDTPEIRGAERQDGLRSKAFVVERLTGLGPDDLIVETIQDSKGKYGRWLARIHYRREGVWTDLNQELIDTGHAKSLSRA